MYSSFPFFLSLNSSYGGWLLSPVLEFASSNAWGNPYAPRDIGGSLSSLSLVGLILIRMAQV